MKKPTIRRGFVDTPDGQIHYATAGQGKPLLLLHQTPRSWAEYLYVLPIFAEKYWTIAMDTVGFGDSYKPERQATIEGYAQGVIAFLAAMSIPRNIYRRAPHGGRDSRGSCRFLPGGCG